MHLIFIFKFKSSHFLWCGYWPWKGKKRTCFLLYYYGLPYLLIFLWILILIIQFLTYYCLYGQVRELGGNNGARPHLHKEELQDGEGFILYGPKNRWGR
jgi:uncharacterized membrane protein